MTSLSLYNIETELAQLIDAREQAEAESEPPETLAVIDQQIQAYFVAEVRKVDGIARYIHNCKAQAAAARAEGDRLYRWGARWESRLERVKAATIYAMGAVGLKKIESAENRLRLQKNPASVDVYDVKALPDEFLNATVRMSMSRWKQIVEAARDQPELFPWLSDTVVNTDVDKRAVAAALKARVPCPHCDSVGKSIDIEAHIVDCPQCEGEKTILVTVPGARWAPETEHLRCE
jgi:hypothetical protein